MDHYDQRQGHYEREPLDPSHQPYDTPSRQHAYQQPQQDYSQYDSPYYDSPQRRGNSASPTRSQYQPQARYDSSPTRRDPEAPPPPRHGGGGNAYPPRPDPHQRRNSGASGGMPPMAYGHNSQENAMEAQNAMAMGQVLPPPSRMQNPNLPRQTYSPRQSVYGPQGYAAHSQDRLDNRDSRSTLNPFGTTNNSSRGSRSSSRSPHVSMGDPYGEDLYNPSSYNGTPRHGPTALGMVDPNDIDDGDDGIDYGHPRRSHRNSVHSGSNSDRAVRGIGAAAAVGAAAGGASAMREPAYPGYHERREKSSDWLEQKDKKSKRWRWAVIILVALVIAGAIVGGVVGTLVSNRKDKDDDDRSPSDDAKGDLDKNSADIKKILNNANLHKVFPGMDYTPMNTQYPDCIHNPPSQNNVTRDVAVLSQLTNKIRLYGTDCNQTQMVLHALKKLDLEDDIKIWLGVWQDSNKTTNARQLSAMWDILDKHGDKPFEGIIMANEVLFREDFTVTSLGNLMDEVRSNLTSKSLKLPIATSDLGDKWDASLAKISDYVMANVHPFFAGTPADKAAKWTLDFFKSHDSNLISDKSKGIISETGWPTSGGKDCGDGGDDCSPGAVASIDGLNRFLDDWVCSSLENNINYFWFSAFDEPWKERFNTKGKEWEDQWGLMDVNRNLKKGVKIPDCDGKTVS